MKKLELTLIVILILFSQTLLALNPSRTYKVRPDKYNMIYKEVKVKTTDGAVLNVWDFPSKTKTSSLVLIAHNGEGNMADYLRRVSQFTSSGHHVVIFDYRGFGESSEFEIDNNMYVYPHFQNDFKAMIDYCRKTHTPTFSLYGWGIGAGLSLGIGYNRQEITKIIADTPFLSMEDLETRFADWDSPMEIPFAGYEKRYEPATALKGTPGKNLKKVQLIIGSNDILFNSKDMAILSSSKQKSLFAPIYVVENPDRKDNFRAAKAAYFAKITTLLGE